MSAFFTRAPFAVVAPLLHDYGYPPVPIRPGGKAPLIDDWQAGHPPAHYLPRCARWGTGILTATCPAVDLDIRDRELVRVLIELAGEILGPSPFRVGAPPKALLPFSATVTFDKITGRWWGLPGDNWRHPDYAPHRVEILCDGQQFVAFARHPRGTYYRWRRHSPISTPHAGLPTIDEGDAKAFLETAERIIKGVGATPLKRLKGAWVPDVPEPTRRRANNGSATRPDDWRHREPKDVAQAIDPKGARQTRRGWDCRCPVHQGVGHTSLGIKPGDDGRLVVNCFAGCSFADIAREIERIVGRAA